MEQDLGRWLARLGRPGPVRRDPQVPHRNAPRLPQPATTTVPPDRPFGACDTSGGVLVRISLRGRRAGPGSPYPWCWWWSPERGVWLMTRDSTGGRHQHHGHRVHPDHAGDRLRRRHDRRPQDQRRVASRSPAPSPRSLVAEGDKVHKGARARRGSTTTALVASRHRRARRRSTPRVTPARRGRGRRRQRRPGRRRPGRRRLGAGRPRRRPAGRRRRDPAGHRSPAPSPPSTSSKGDVVGIGSSSAAPTTGRRATDGSTDTSTGTISIVSTGRYVVDATVAAADVDQLKKGLQAEIAVTGVDRHRLRHGLRGRPGRRRPTTAARPSSRSPSRSPASSKDLYAGVSATVDHRGQAASTTCSPSPAGRCTTEDGKTYVDQGRRRRRASRSRSRPARRTA